MDEPEVKIIDVFICKLLKKLAHAGAADLIGTVWGRGYVLRDPAVGTVAPMPMQAPRAVA
jgi:two-component system cell cycle response regulator CtrA